MSAGGVRLALAAWLRLPRLRRAASLRHQDPCPLPVHVLPTADLADRRHDFAATKMPLRSWFRAMYHLTQSKGGISSLELGRRLGVTQNTAWKLKHKLMQVMMEQDAGKRLTGRVEMDDAYLGGERCGGKRGRGAPGKTPIIAAVETTPGGKPVRLKLRRVSGFRRKEVAKLARRSLDPTSTLISDGFASSAVSRMRDARISRSAPDPAARRRRHPPSSGSTPRSATSRPPSPPPTGLSARSTSLATWPNSRTASVGATISPP